MKPNGITAHQLARELLAGPDVLVIMPVPTFDMPGAVQALPVEIKPITVEEVPCLMVCPASSPSTEEMRNVWKKL